MTEMEFGQQVLPAIKARWPNYGEKFDDAQQKVQFEYLRNRDVNVTLQAMSDHHRDDPDRRAPKWKEVWRLIKEGSQRSRGANAFEILIDNIRADLIGNGCKRAADMTPEELWLNHLDANTNCIIYDGTGKRRDDETGARQRLFQNARAAQAQHWAGYLSGRGGQVPDFLRIRSLEYAALEDPKPKKEGLF